MAKFAVFQSHQNAASDKPSHCSKSIASLLLRTAKAVLVCDRTIQMLAPTANIENVTITAEMQRAARYDQAVNQPPIGYHQTSPTKLMFGQMWEKRASLGFEILQLCPPHRKSDVTEATA